MSTFLNPDAVKDSSIAKSKLDTALTYEINGKQEALTLTVKDNGNIVLANIQGQSKEFMPATPSGDPMHYAYVAAGAEYNDTGEDIVKTTPWAGLVDDDADKTVVHKAGYWYLNGLGDITNNEMRQIYNGSIYFLSANTAVEALRYTNFRTNINLCNYKGGYSPVSLYGMLFDSKIEVVNFRDKVMVNLITYFCSKSVKFIIGQIKLNSVKSFVGAFTSGINLKVVKLNGVALNISFASSSFLSSKSILYMIQNEAATSPITITLHADVYNKCMANADILAALETHTNVSLASA